MKFILVGKRKLEGRKVDDMGRSVMINKLGTRDYSTGISIEISITRRYKPC
jgi:hypothetical protein